MQNLEEEVTEIFKEQNEKVGFLYRLDFWGRIFWKDEDAQFKPKKGIKCKSA